MSIRKPLSEAGWNECVVTAPVAYGLPRSGTTTIGGEMFQGYDELFS